MNYIAIQITNAFDFFFVLFGYAIWICIHKNAYPVYNKGAWLCQ